MKIITDFFLILIVLLSVNNVNGQKDLRIGYINMEYILSNIQDFEIANKEFDYKIEQWKNEIFEREKEIKTKRNYVLHFKSGSFDRWVNGVNESNEQMIKILGDNYGKFFEG